MLTLAENIKLYEILTAASLITHPILLRKDDFLKSMLVYVNDLLLKEQITNLGFATEVKREILCVDTIDRFDLHTVYTIEFTTYTFSVLLTRDGKQVKNILRTKKN